MFPFNFKDLIPEHIRNSALNTMVEFIYSQVKSVVGDELAEKIKYLRSDRKFQTEFTEGISHGILRFFDNYPDREVAVFVFNHPEIFRDTNFKKSLLAVIKRPDGYYVKEKEEIILYLCTYFPNQYSYSRVERAFEELLKNIVVEVWGLQEIAPFYMLFYLRRMDTGIEEIKRAIVAQQMATLLLNAELRNALLKITELLLEIYKQNQLDARPRKHLLENNNDPSYLLDPRGSDCTKPRDIKDIKRPKQIKNISRSNALTTTSDQSATNDVDEVTVIINDSIRIPMCYIPKGRFLFGESRTSMNLESSCWISKYPVTNELFSYFVHQKSYKTQAEKKGFGSVHEGNWVDKQGANWRNPLGPGSSIANKMDHPVVQVSWDDAIAFCDWLSGLLRADVRLPTVGEWVKAFRGVDGRTFTWGETKPTGDKCNCCQVYRGTTPVGMFSSKSTSPYHCDDMVGNVWEWTYTAWGFNYDSSDYSSVYQNDNRDTLSGGTFRILKGGAYYNAEVCYTAYNSIHNFHEHCGCGDGFRICAPNLKVR